MEAGIAYWHTTDHKDKWKNILQLYNQLVLIEYSPITALNRTFAFSKVYGHGRAISEAGKLNLKDNNQYHGLMGYLFGKSDIQKAIEYYQKAIKLTKSETEKRTLKKEIERLKIKNGSIAKKGVERSN